MAEYNFTFYFPELDIDLQTTTINSWGGNLGSALRRAWTQLRTSKKYRNLKKLRPLTIGISYPVKKRGS